MSTCITSVQGYALAIVSSVLATSVPVAGDLTIEAGSVSRMIRCLGTFFRAFSGRCVFLACLLLTVPAIAQQDQAFIDPLLELNEPSFALNRGLDTVAFRPLSIVYRELVPKPARRGVSNVLANLDAPAEALNHVLQLNLDGAATTTLRFAINSTVGIAGIADVASEAGLHRQRTDFGVTLARYGVGEGAYLVVPVLGPSTIRDFAGTVANFVFNPLHVTNLVELKTLEWGAYYTVSSTSIRLEFQDLLDDVYYEDEFGYARLRAFYLQNRRHRVSGGEIEGSALPDIDLDYDDLLPEEGDENAKE